jgi:ribonuclease P protein component
LRFKSLRFPSTYRLKNSRDFNRAFQRGRRLSTPFFRFLLHRNTLAHPRLGIAIGRRTARKAHERNRIKRLIRESFRLHAQHIGGIDVVVHVNPTASVSSNTVLSRVLDGSWNAIERCLRPLEASRVASGEPDGDQL